MFEAEIKTLEFESVRRCIFACILGSWKDRMVTDLLQDNLKLSQNGALESSVLFFPRVSLQVKSNRLLDFMDTMQL